MADLVAEAGTPAVGRDRRQLRINKGAEGRDQIVVVVQVAAVNRVALIETVIKANELLTEIEWIRLLKERIVARRRVGVRDSAPFHRRVDIGKSLAVRCDPVGRN